MHSGRMDIVAVMQCNRCWPTLRATYVTVYYSLALIAAVSAVRAKSVVMRALPMLVGGVSSDNLRWWQASGAPVCTFICPHCCLQFPSSKWQWE